MRKTRFKTARHNTFGEIIEEDDLGYLCGPFGIHKEGETWRVTHLVTGGAIGKFFLTFQWAKKFAEELRKMDAWSDGEFGISTSIPRGLVNAAWKVYMRYRAEGACDVYCR